MKVFKIFLRLKYSEIKNEIMEAWGFLIAIILLLALITGLILQNDIAIIISAIMFIATFISVLSIISISLKRWLHSNWIKAKRLAELED